MSFLLAAGGVALATFVLAYVRPGRFGVATLALGAGYLWALLWADTLADYRLAQVPYVAWNDAVYGGLVLVPGVLALLFGSKQKSLLPRLVAAFLLAVFTVALLLPLFGAAPSGEPYASLQQNQDGIITAVLLLGLLDVLFSRSPKPPKRGKD